MSRVEASSHSESRVYVSLNGYRWDDFTPYVYRSDDYGTTWTNIGSSLPASPVNVIKEDPHNENIIYVGTDNGAYVSLDRGSSWQVFVEGLPNVAFHDLVVQPEANHLVLGTHGRSIYLGDVSLLQKMDGDKMDQVLVGELAGMRVSRRWGSSFSPFFDAFEPSMDVQYYVPAGDEAKVTILSEAGDELNSFSVDAAKGLNQMSYDLTVSKKGVKAMDKAGTMLTEADNGSTYLPKGKYTLKIEAGKASGSGTFELK